MVLVLRLDTDIPGSYGVKNRAPSTCIKRYPKLVALISLCDRKSSSWRLASICQLVDPMSLKDNGSLLVARMQDKEVKPMALHPLAAGTSQFLLQPQLPHPQNASLTSRLLGIQPDPAHEASYYMAVGASVRMAGDVRGIAFGRNWEEIKNTKCFSPIEIQLQTSLMLICSTLSNTSSHPSSGSHAKSI